jgi:type I restriction enzyme S subunit
MSELEKPFEIPEHWDWSTFDEIGEWTGGGTPSKRKTSYWEGDIPWVSPKDMKRLEIDDTQDHVTETALEDSATNRVPEDSLLFVTRSGILERTLPTARATVAVTINQDLKAFTLSEGVDPQFLLYYTRAAERSILRQCSKHGTTVASLESGRLYRFPVPLPAPSEQRRIVAKIEELFSNLDAGMDDLQTAEQQLERYRLSVLQAAVEGRLTADWRETHDPEPAEQLHNRIRTEKQRLYDKGEIRKPKERPAPEEDEIPFSIPEGWSWIRITELMYNWRSGLEKRNSEQGSDLEYPYIKMGDITNDGRLTLDSVTRVDAEPEDVKKYELSRGDFLFNVRNSKKLVGKSCVFDVESDETYLFNNNILRVDFGRKVSTKYINYWFCSAAGRDMLEELKSSTTNVAAIYHKDFFTCIVPLPPLAEQKQIIDEVERLLSVADDASDTADREHTRAERLRQSILKQAFSGQLVPHDDEADPPAIAENGSSEPNQGTSDDGNSSSSSGDDVAAEELYDGNADPEKQIEMDL